MDLADALSAKMFKDRLKDWDVHKKYTEQDVRDLFQRLADGLTTTHDAKIHGRPVKWARVRRRVSEAKHALQLSAHDNSLLERLVQMQKVAKQKSLLITPRNQMTEDIFNKHATTSNHSPEVLLELGHQVLAVLKPYLTQRLFASGRREYLGYIDSWLPDMISVGHPSPPFNKMIHPVELNQNLARGLSMLVEARFVPASSFVLRAADALDMILPQQHGALTSCLLEAFTGNLPFYPRIRRTMSQITLKAAVRTLGIRHPITLLCKFLCICTNSQEASSIFYFWRHYCRLYSEALTIENTMTIYINQKYLEKLIEGCRYDEALTHMQRSLDPVFSSLLRIQPSVAVNIPASLWYLRRGARLLRCLGNMKQALRTLKVSSWIITAALSKLRDGIAGSPILEEIFRTIDEVALYLSSFEAEEYQQYSILAHEVALSVCVAVRGEQDSKTLSMVSTLEQEYQRRGLADRADTLISAYPGVFVRNDGNFEPMSRHCLPCPSCGNGPNTQIFCDKHFTSVHDREGQMEEIVHQVGNFFARFQLRLD